MKNQHNLQPQTARQRCRKIFGYPKPPLYVWEKEFDYNDKALHALAAKDWEEIAAHDLSMYYVHNLQYVEPLQPELFNYLFPIFLAVWNEQMIENRQTGFTDYFYRVLQRPYLWDEMMNEKQREEVRAFIVDSVIERLQSERGFVYNRSETPAYTWFHALDDIGCCLPVIESIWHSWWRLDDPGKAVCALMYASALIYWEADNPIFGLWTPEHGGGAPAIQIPMHDENSRFLIETLTVDFIVSKTVQAANALKGEPEGELAQRIADDAKLQQDIIALQLDELRQFERWHTLV